MKRDHRLRLHVAASDFPLYLPDPGTGGDPWSEVDRKAVPYGLTSRSVLTLSVLPQA